MLKCEVKKPKLHLTLTSAFKSLESPVILMFFFFLFNNGDFKIDEQTPNIFEFTLQYIWNSFGPKRRIIKLLKPYQTKPFMSVYLLHDREEYCCNHLPPKYRSILNLFSNPEKCKWPYRSLVKMVQLGSKYLRNPFFFGTSAVYSVVRLNRFKLWFVSP